MLKQLLFISIFSTFLLADPINYRGLPTEFFHIKLSRDERGVAEAICNQVETFAEQGVSCYVDNAYAKAVLEFSHSKQTCYADPLDTQPNMRLCCSPPGGNDAVPKECFQKPMREIASQNGNTMGPLDLSYSQ